jgi:hypothetical protein
LIMESVCQWNFECEDKWKFNAITILKLEDLSYYNISLYISYKIIIQQKLLSSNFLLNFMKFFVLKIKAEINKQCSLFFW